jgi:hypothetical protein
VVRKILSRTLPLAFCIVHIENKEKRTESGFHKLLQRKFCFLISNTFQETDVTCYFDMLPCGVVSLSCNEAIQTTQLELGFRRSPGKLYQHTPPIDSVL